VNFVEKKINKYLLITILTTICLVILGVFLIYVYEIICVQIVMREPLEKVTGVFDISYWDYKLENDLAKNLVYTNGNFSLRKTYINLIKDNKLWLQLIDEDGNEVFSYLKPSKYRKNYTATSLLSTFKKPHWEMGYTVKSAMIKHNNKNYTYLLGFPNQYGLSYEQARLLEYILMRILLLVVIIIVSSYIAAKIYSKFMIQPLLKVVDSIKNLANENYDNIFQDKKIFTDVSNNLYKLAIKLKKAKKERIKLDKTRNELISNIVHDIKTPLSSVKGYIEMLSCEEQYNLTLEEKKRYTEIAVRKTDYIDKLLEELSLSYKLDSNIYQLNKRSNNLVSILQYLIINILNDIKYQEQIINFVAASEEIIINCDKLLLERAFNNILHNALIHNSLDTVIDVEVKNDKDNIIVVIKDNGKGISAEEIEKLFERYYRGTDTNKNTNGTGLGLAIAKQIIESHNGTISIESKLSIGTIIKICFKGK